MSKNENSKKVLKKTLVLEVCYENAHKTKKITQKSVTIIFIYFKKKNLGVFSVIIKMMTNDDEKVEKVDGETYGPLKALCEQAASEIFGGARSTNVRPGLIVGPDDNTDRFTYWPARAARGGRMIAPGDPLDPVQFIDVRDLAAFTLRLIENEVGGVFNAISSPGQFSIGDVVNESIAAARELAKPVVAPTAEWLNAKTLEAQKVQPWSDMPVWAPSTGDSVGFASSSVERAKRAGLAIRPLRETVRDTLRWHLARPEAERQKLKAGLTVEREAELLATISVRG